MSHGLDYQNLSRVLIVSDVAIFALSNLLRSTALVASDRGVDTGYCSTQQVFHTISDLQEAEGLGIGPCLDSICRNRYLDPDLSGIGVSLLPLCRIYVELT